MTAAPADAPAAPQSPTGPGLQHLPVGIFASVMGIGGLALAWQGAAHRWDLPAATGETLAWVALGALALATVAYAAKAILHPAAVRAEATHPVKAAFIATVPIGALVTATALLEVQEGLSFGLWAVGATLQAAVTLYVMHRWIADATITQTHIHPAWFIPVVGNLVVPLAGVEHADADLSWLFFGVGIVYWLGLLPVVLARLFTAGVIPPRLAPTLAILVAPPAVASLAWVRLGGSWDDPAARILLGVTLFQVCLLLVQSRSLRKAPWAVSAWAYTFPLAAASRAFLQTADGAAWWEWVGAVSLAAATMLVAAMAVRTIIAARRGELTSPEPTPPGPAA
ncbi:SLAC1 anion channel family protein [Demequina zhanjiangensis]|uniref:SLAC1 anion channel family protein n=1 Tax=Demequina zhanjiangensis TaxID=3051659 RepID=A0ABT8G172_9MICO|nr:SLAC1 anion channel family protein [Demequina sp. SYSU T00b26]MDN4472891.1 SLAC1 anion channel family protein [Demequina sp. SYSU T00b26]